MKKSALAAAICLSLLLTACGGGGASSAGGDMSANLPMGLPLMAGATVVHNTNELAKAHSGNATAILTSAESVDDVYDYYSDAMSDAGFDDQREVEVGDIKNLSAAKDGLRGMVTVKPDKGKTMVMIVVNGEGQ
jgi:hypothetical protein